MPQFALAIEDLLAPFPREAHGLRERSEEFDDLSDVVVVFTVLRSRLRIEEIVASDEFKDLSLY